MMHVWSLWVPIINVAHNGDGQSVHVTYLGHSGADLCLIAVFPNVNVFWIPLASGVMNSFHVEAEFLIFFLFQESYIINFRPYLIFFSISVDLEISFNTLNNYHWFHLSVVNLFCNIFFYIIHMSILSYFSLCHIHHHFDHFTGSTLFFDLIMILTQTFIFFYLLVIPYFSISIPKLSV